jgi:hypothetical protein
VLARQAPMRSATRAARPPCSNDRRCPLIIVSLVLVSPAGVAPAGCERSAPCSRWQCKRDRGARAARRSISAGEVSDVSARLTSGMRDAQGSRQKTERTAGLSVMALPSLRWCEYTGGWCETPNASPDPRDWRERILIAGAPMTEAASLALLLLFRSTNGSAQGGRPQRRGNAADLQATRQ